ncbi:MAG TPA: chitobiase/beta-hexosaminidase C-terminal domain-containing protein [Gemmatimonadaceae bacterium]
MAHSRVLVCLMLLLALSSGHASAQVAVAAGDSHVIVLTDHGTLWGWGADGYGQLGQGSTATARPMPVQITISSVIAVAAGTYSSYALGADGVVWAWGANGSGQLGNGSTVQSSTPVPVNELTGIVAIAAGDTFAFALKDDGTLWAWGDNAFGQLGDGTTVRRTAPVQVISLGASVSGISAASQHAHALKSDGTVWSWGSNGSGQLGDGTATTRTTPVPSIDLAAIMVDVVLVRAAPFKAFAFTSVPSLWGWGYNQYGQLADGTTANRSRPVQSAFAGAIDIRGGVSHTVALKSDGSVWTWGYNNSGQLGDGTTTQRTTPAPVNGVEAVAVASGTYSVVAVSADGRVWTWGRNSSGQLGDGTTTNSLSPVQISDAEFRWRVATPSFSYPGGNYGTTLNVAVTCATAGATIRYTVDGSVPTEASPAISAGTTVPITQNTTLKARAWKSAFGASNVAEATYTLTPGAPWFSPGGGTYTSARTVTIGTTTPGAEIRYTLDGTTPSGSSTLYMAPLQIGTGTTLKAIARRSGWNDGPVTSATYVFNYGALPPPVLTPPSGEYPYGQEVAIAAQSGATIRYTTDGSQVTALSPVYTGPIVLMGTRTISAKAFHPDWTASPAATGTYAVRVGAPRFTPDAGTYPAGQRITIDDATFGAVIHYTTDGSDPTESDPVIPSESSLVACSCTLKARAFLAGWTPSDVREATYSVTGRLNDGVAVGGASHSAVLAYDGTVWTWGGNSLGQLGDGTPHPRHVPRPVDALTGIVALAAGDDHMLAVDNGGGLWAWGANGSGQIGTGSTNQWSGVSRVTSLDGVAAVAAGSAFSMALKNDGTVWTWGANTHGQLGDGTQNPRSTPAQVPSLANVVAIAAGANHALALRVDGTVWAWGHNGGGPLGDGTSINRYAPVQTSVITNVTRIAAGSNQSFAIDASGVSWAWGWNAAGQLGTNGASPSIVPQRVLLSDGEGIATGNVHSVAVASDGLVWTWGSDWMGQLGNDAAASPQQNGPAVLGDLASVARVAAGWGQTLVITADGAVWAWGGNGSGQIGDGTTEHRFVPVQIAEAGFAWKASTPTLSPGAGTYTTPTLVVLNAATPGATIHYTTSGVDPTPADPGLASGSTLLADETLTLKAVAVKNGMPRSNVAAAVYTMNLPAPSFSPASGTYAGSMPVSLVCAVAGVEIRYSTDGTDPTASSAPYTAPLAIDASTTIKARAFRAGWSDSPVSTGAFVLKASPPSLTPGTGTYGTGTPVSIETATPGAVVRYTLDGTDPTETSTVYSAPLSLTTTGTIKARAYRAGWTSSDSAAATYWVTEGAVASPLLLPPGAAYTGPVMVSMSCATPEATIRYTLDGREPDAASPLYRWPIMVDATVTLKARAFRPHFTPSDLRVETYRIGPIDAVATPVIQPGGGRFTTWQRVTITVATADAVIRYTTDGSDPTESDPAVPAGGTFDVGRAMVLKARAFKTGSAPSATRRTDFIVAGALGAGDRTGYAVKADGTVWSWGENTFGQTGTGASSLVPVQVPGLNDVVQISIARFHVLAVGRDGSVWTWGRNDYGVLGHGDYVARTSPTPVSGIGDIVAVAAGETHTLALAADGSLWAWGANAKGQLGDGTTTDRLAPTRVLGISNVRAIAAGEDFSLALQDDGGFGGVLWAWGGNSYGQLGDGSTLNRSVPVRIPALPRVFTVDAGGGFAHAVSTDGRVWGWGWNAYGQVGDTTFVDRSVPVPLPMLAGVGMVSDGLIHSAALNARGEVWTWGDGGDYRIGGYDFSKRAYALWVNGVRAAILLATGSAHTLVGAADGHVYAWGSNAVGQLGDATTTPKSNPVLIPDLRLADNDWLAADLDGDGVPTWREYELGTDPLDADTNDDGVHDGASADSALESANPDSDGDGLTNAAEGQLGTNPFAADSDDDGVTDAIDAFPLDPSRSERPAPNPADTTPPSITLTEPVSARPIPPP